MGDMIVARDPLGIKPLCYAVEGPLFAAASESVALLNLGFAPESIKSLLPGQAITITDGQLGDPAVRPQSAAGPLLLRVDLFRQRGQHAGRAQRLPVAQGAWARSWPGWKTVPIDDDTIVVPVPDTSKAAADAMAYELKVPCVEGLIRNRYTAGRSSRAAATASARPRPSTRRCAKCWKASGCCWSRIRSSARRRMKVLLQRIRAVGAAAGDSRPRGLPADHRAVLLRHRHVDGQRAVRAAVSARAGR